MAKREEKRAIIVQGERIDYVYRKSTRAQNLRISIESSGTCVVTGPYFLKESMATAFLIRKSTWVRSVLGRFRKLGFPKPLKIPRSLLQTYKEQALAHAEQRIKFFNETYGLSYGKIQIRNQKSRWGSCSKKGNINFNVKMMLLPERLRDYVVVHELCHVGEFNHSKKFWDLVARTIPDHKEIRKELRRNASFY